MILKGKAYKYGSNINTDEIIPARYLNTSNPNELAAHCMEGLDKEFVNKVKPGDFIVAEENFGCGSSREHAPLSIKYAYVSCVIAKSFARIFYRNSINIGLPILESPEAVNGIQSGDMLEVNLSTGKVTNITRSKVYSTQVFPDFMQEIIRRGGLLEYIINKSESKLFIERKAEVGDRRSVPRITTSGIPVEIYDEDGLTILGIGYILNLGINCAGLETTVNLARNQDFFMRFLVESKYLVHVWAKIVRVVLEDRKKYYGVRFSKIDLLHERDLKRFLMQKLRDSGGK